MPTIAHHYFLVGAIFHKTGFLCVGLVVLEITLSLLRDGGTAWATGSCPEASGGSLPVSALGSGTAWVTASRFQVV